MFTDFLELFGVDLYGLAFERTFWLLGLVLSSWGAYGGVMQVREGDREGGFVRLAVSAAALLFFIYSAYNAFFAPAYELMFQEEIIVHTYALCIVTGFLLAAWVAAREGARVGIPSIRLLDFSFWALISGMLGARLLFIIVSADEYIDACTNEGDCLRALKFWEGGLVFFGAFLGATICVVLYARRWKIPFLVLFDTVIPSLALGHFFGRLGCLGAGCCWGQTCTMGFGLEWGRGTMPYEDTRLRYFSGDSTVGDAFMDLGHTEAVHPTQLYESFGELWIFLALIIWRPHKRFHGEITAIWFMLYGTFRTFTEMMRGDKVRGYWAEIDLPFVNKILALPPEHHVMLTTSQIVGMSLFVIGLTMLIYHRRKVPPVGEMRPSAGSG